MIFSAYFHSKKKVSKLFDTVDSRVSQTPSRPVQTYKKKKPCPTSL